MKQSFLEHVNLTVKKPDELAELFCRLFNWKIRWHGEALNNGRTVHVGSDDSYLALYTHDDIKDSRLRDTTEINNINHLAIVVTDIDEVEAKVKDEGYESFNFGEYEPGKRFYFMIGKLEIEVVDYT